MGARTQVIIKNSNSLHSMNWWRRGWQSRISLCSFSGLVLLLCWISPGQGQTSHRKDIETLRRQIHDLEQKLQKQTQQESQTIEIIDTIDQKISLTKNLLSRLKKEIRSKRRRIDSLKTRRARLADRLTTLQDLIKRRMVNLYKHGQTSALEMLLSAQSINQVRVWAEYQRRLAENDARNLRSYRRRQAQLTRVQRQIENNLQEQVALLQEKQSEEKTLKQDRLAKKKLLRTIRKDKKTYQRQLEDYQRAIQEIQRIIASSEKERLKAQQIEAVKRADLPAGENFSALKGSLPWPVRGKIIRHYGPYKHPVLKTITDNLGIDIQVRLGAEVHAVAAGKVTAITWQRGRGNLVIINHGDGYYTVYTHLNEIFVELNQHVLQGQIIGVVGETGTFDKPVLHFQVWHKFDHMDPETWLRP
ncbi:MAG: hypothetical protein D6814_08655 [Calditrichaeota bacterium]|nr:MAG: hypothetical protein D6814_08655 [Calditrichota bacterium]